MPSHEKIISYYLYFCFSNPIRYIYKIYLKSWAWNQNFKAIVLDPDDEHQKATNADCSLDSLQVSWDYALLLWLLDSPVLFSLL